MSLRSLNNALQHCQSKFPNSFIHILAISIVLLQVSYCSEALPTQHGYCASEFHAEVQQATAREGLAQGPYKAARAGFEPTTHVNIVT